MTSSEFRIRFQGWLGFQGNHNKRERKKEGGRMRERGKKNILELFPKKGKRERRDLMTS